MFQDSEIKIFLHYSIILFKYFQERLFYGKQSTDQLLYSKSEEKQDCKWKKKWHKIGLSLMTSLQDIFPSLLGYLYF